MTLFLISFVVVTLAVLGMSVGVLVGRPPLRGTCGSCAGAVDCANKRATCAPISDLAPRSGTEPS